MVENIFQHKLHSLNHSSAMAMLPTVCSTVNPHFPHDLHLSVPLLFHLQRHSKNITNNRNRNIKSVSPTQRLITSFFQLRMVRPFDILVAKYLFQCPYDEHFFCFTRIILHDSNNRVNFVRTLYDKALHLFSFSFRVRVSVF